MNKEFQTCCLFCEAQFPRHVYQKHTFPKPKSSQVQAAVRCLVRNQITNFNYEKQFYKYFEFLLSHSAAKIPTGISVLNIFNKQYFQTIQNMFIF